MADYSTPTVIEPVIPISAMKPIERIFLANVFEEEVLGDSVYYSSSDGAKDSISLAAADVRAALVDASPERCLVHKLIEEQAGACIDGDDIELDGCGDHWPDVLQEIVRRSPGLDHLTVTMAFTCSKMRSRRLWWSLDDDNGCHDPLGIDQHVVRPVLRRSICKRGDQSWRFLIMRVPTSETLMRAAKAGDLALMECTEVASGETRYVLCAVGRDDGDYVMTPFGHLAPGNPYEAYIPPA